MTVDPQKTYALVVGVEKYDASPKWDLDGPANDADKYVEWLLSRNVPAANILSYISPLDKYADEVRAGTPAATRENIYQALTGLLAAKRDGALLYVFWSGHGMITPENERLLFYANATQQNILNLDLNSLLTSLRSNYFAGFGQQIFFIDACANYVANWRTYSTLPHETFPGGDPLAVREQFVCLAAKPGEYAKNISRQQTGLFSQTVREELEKEGVERWPPDMPALSESLTRRFEVLREAGLAKQTPTYFWFKNWSGTERILGDVRAHTPVEEDTLELPLLKFEQMQELARLLWRCSNSMQFRNKRDLVLRGLPQDVQWALNRDDRNDLTDIQLIIVACQDYFDGIGELLKVVRSYEGRSLPMQRVDAFIKEVLAERSI